MSLTGQDVAAVVVASIGGPALARLISSGIRVLRCPGGTVRDALALLAAGKLEELSGEGTCAGHDHGRGSSCSCGSQWSLAAIRALVRANLCRIVDEVGVRDLLPDGICRVLEREE